MDSLLPNPRFHFALAVVLAVATLAVILLPGAEKNGPIAVTGESGQAVAFAVADDVGVAILGAAWRAD